MRGGAKLSTIDCIAQSLSVGPIFSAAVIGSALAGLSGGVGPFIVILTAIGIGCIGYVVSELSKRYSGSGAVYELIAHTAGKTSGIFGAAVYYFAVLTLTVALPIIGGIQLNGFVQSHMGTNIPWWVFGLVIVGFVTVLSLRGVSVSVKTQLVIITLSVLPFLLLAVVIIAKGGATGNSLDGFNPSKIAEGGSVFKGLLFAILMFVGFEVAASLGEETDNPQKSIPTAVLATIGIVAVFYIVTQYVGNIGSGGPNKIPFDFVALSTEYVGRWLGVLVEIAIILDVLAIAIGFTATASRGLFTLSRDGLLPKKLSVLNGRLIPSIATIAIAVIGVIVTLVTQAKYGTTAGDAGPDALNGFFILATTGGMLFCVTYVILCVGAIRHFVGVKNMLGVALALIGGVTAAGGILAQFIDGTAPVGDALWGRHLGIAAVVVLGGWLAFLVSTRKDCVAAAAEHALQHAL